MSSFLSSGVNADNNKACTAIKYFLCSMLIYVRVYT